jgi:hypothetical protein
MRAFAVHGAELQLCLADVGADVEQAVAELAFARRGAVWARTFPGDAPYAERAAARFETRAETMVRQTARLEPTAWDEALATLLERAPDGWWLAGSAALAARGLAVEPRDLDVIADAAGCEQLAEAVADLLVEPLVDGGFLGERWFRAFAGARLECVGGVHAEHADTDFGATAAARLETVDWNGRRVRVPPLDLQLEVSERRGLRERAALIREALQ